MPTPTPPPPPPPPAAFPRRPRPWLLRWWSEPVQRKRVLAATALALLYGSGVAYGSWTRVSAAERGPSIMRVSPERDPQIQSSKVYAADGRLISEDGSEDRTGPPREKNPVDRPQAVSARGDKR